MGLWTYTKTHRHLNTIRKDATGKFASFSIVSTYTLTATAYTETLLFSLRTDQPGGKDPVYDLSGQTQSTPVTADGGRLQFTLPFEPRALIFEGNKAPRPPRTTPTWTSGKRLSRGSERDRPSREPAELPTKVKEVVTLLVKSRWSIFNDLGLRVSRGISTVLLVFKCRIQDRFSERF
jgi:hypothetical protein